MKRISVRTSVLSACNVVIWQEIHPLFFLIIMVVRRPLISSLVWQPRLHIGSNEVSSCGLIAGIGVFAQAHMLPWMFQYRIAARHVQFVIITAIIMYYSNQLFSLWSRVCIAALRRPGRGRLHRAAQRTVVPASEKENIPPNPQLNLFSRIILF